MRAFHSLRRSADMRIANLRGRAVLVDGNSALDIADASDGKFGPAPLSILREWDDFLQWASNAPVEKGVAFNRADLGAPIPDPGQVFAIGLNYRDQWGKKLSVYGSYSFADNTTFTNSNTLISKQRLSTTRLTAAPII